MTPATDVFMQGHEPPTRRPGDFYRNKQGTPYVSDPAGRLVKPKRKADPPRIATTPYSRPSGFGKIIEDMYSIHKWDERQEAYGFAVEPTLVERAGVLLTIEDRESQEWKDEADKIVKAAKIAAKSSLAADRGTHAHELTEDDDEGRDIIARIEAGEEMGLSPDVQRSLVAAWREMLARDQLEILAVEMPVVNDTYRGAGTLDRVGRLLAPLRFTLVTGEVVELPAGWTGILDVKSGKRRLRSNGTVMYWHGYAVQVFLYASGVPYDTETDTRGEWGWEIDQKWALIAHLDVLGAIDGRPSCDLILVDLEAGRRAADLCVAAKAWGNESTVFSVAQLDVAGEAEVLQDPAAEPPATAGEGEADSSSDPSPALTVSYEGKGGTHTTVTTFLAPDPARLAVVQARDQLTATPDQGDDLSGADYGEQWAILQRHYEDLDDACRSWLAELISAATRRGLSFHARHIRSVRTYELYRALISLCASGADGDELLRALLYGVVGDIALFPGVEPGHVLGSLGHLEATALANLVDAFHAGTLKPSVDDDGTLRLTAA